MEIDEFHYGKLVVSEGGRIHPNSGYAFTYRSEGISDPNTLMPGSLLGLSRFDDAVFDRAHSSSRGVLIFRALEDGRIAIGRARYRSENGEGLSGRSYLQVRVVLVKAKDWRAEAPSWALWAHGLEARPDLMRTPPAQRFNVPPTPVALDIVAVPISRVEAEELLSSIRLERVARILHAIYLEDGEECIALGSDVYSGDNAEADFLGDFACALSLARSECGTSLSFKPVAVGVKAGSISSGLTLSPSLKSSQTAPELSLGEIVTLLSSRAENLRWEVGRDRASGESVSFVDTPSWSGPVSELEFSVAPSASFDLVAEFTTMFDMCLVSFLDFRSGRAGRPDNFVARWNSLLDFVSDHASWDAFKAYAQRADARTNDRALLTLLVGVCDSKQRKLCDEFSRLDILTLLEALVLTNPVAAHNVKSGWNVAPNDRAEYNRYQLWSVALRKIVGERCWRCPRPEYHEYRAIISLKPYLAPRGSLLPHDVYVSGLHTQVVRDIGSHQLALEWDSVQCLFGLVTPI